MLGSNAEDDAIVAMLQAVAQDFLAAFDRLRLATEQARRLGINVHAYDYLPDDAKCISLVHQRTPALGLTLTIPDAKFWWPF